MNMFKLSRSQKIAAWLVLFLVFAGILTGFYLYNLKDKDLEKVNPDFIMTATELQMAFDADENAAGEIYVNRVIEVTGEIALINEGESQDVVIILKTGNPMSAVSCSFQAGQFTRDFKEGDQITLRGECSGFLLDVQLNKCKVIKKKN